MAAAYQTTYAGKDESAQSKLALEQLNVIIDRMIDAYARAVAAAGTDAANAQIKAQSSGKLAQFYKFRHEGSDAGMNELIAGFWPSRYQRTVRSRTSRLLNHALNDRMGPVLETGPVWLL